MRKGKGKKKDVGDEDGSSDEIGDWSQSESDFSDLDVDFEPGEEDKKQEEEDELFCETLSSVLRGYNRVPKVAVDEVNQGRVDGVTKGSVDDVGKANQQAGEEQSRPQFVEHNVDMVEEVEYDSEELRSLCGSDDEVDPYPTFIPESDF